MEEINNKPKRFGKNKLVLIVSLSLLAIGLVSAGVLNYFGIIGQSGDITQAIELKQGDNTCDNNEETTGNTFCTETGNAAGGETITSKEYMLTSDTNVKVPVKLVTIVSPTEGTNTKIVGTLKLIKKDITTWTPISGTGKIITYTIVGDTFESSGVPEGYTLIYYKDNEANVDDTERLLVLGESAVLSKNMPHDNDWNAGELADYCNNGIDNYKHCRGAKLWAVPDANIVGGILIWSNPEEFYFETDLIEYNEAGEITIYPDEELDFKVETTFSTGYIGAYAITTEAQVIV